MACHGVISAGFGRNRFCIKLEITPPSISNHSRYGTYVDDDDRELPAPLPLQERGGAIYRQGLH
jgi:hypothetical protein